MLFYDQLTQYRQELFYLAALHLIIIEVYIVEDGDAAIGLGVIEVITLLYHTPKGVYWRRPVYRLIYQGFLYCFCLIQIDLSDDVRVGVCETKTLINTLWGKLSCFEFMMVDVSDALT